MCAGRCCRAGSGLVGCLQVVVLPEQVPNTAHLVVRREGAGMGHTPDDADRARRIRDRFGKFEVYSNDNC